MWFFMNTCYALSVLSFLMLIASALQGYFRFLILNANHATFALVTVMIYLFTETLIIFFFVGTGVSIKEYARDHKFDAQFHRRSIEIKRHIYPPTLLNILLIMILFISGGAVDTRRFPGWAHGVLFYLCIWHFVLTLRIQHRSFKENTAIILEMSGIRS